MNSDQSHNERGLDLRKEQWGRGEGKSLAVGKEEQIKNVPVFQLEVEPRSSRHGSLSREVSVQPPPAHPVQTQSWTLLWGTRQIRTKD